MTAAGPYPAQWGEYFPLLLQFEGEVFENDPHDPGGATKYGIDSRSHPGVDIRALTVRQASGIHEQDYNRSAATRLPFPLNFAFFDFAMNAGEKPATRALQQVVGAKDDGVFGPVTTRRVADYLFRQGAGMLLVKFSNARELHYRNLAATRREMARYLKGWLSRTVAMKTWCALRLPKEGVGQ